MPSSGWNCSRCSFYHQFNSTRCSMCNCLRVTTEDMRNFISGRKNDGECSSIKDLDPKKNTIEKNECILLDETFQSDNINTMTSSTKSNQQQRSTEEVKKVANRTVSTMIFNPYSRKGTAENVNLWRQENGGTMQQTVHNPYLKQQPQQQHNNSNQVGPNVHQQKPHPNSFNHNQSNNVSQGVKMNLMFDSQRQKEHQQLLVQTPMQSTPKVQKQNINKYSTVTQQKLLQKSTKKGTLSKPHDSPTQQRLSITLQPNTASSSNFNIEAEKNIPFDDYVPGPVPLASGDKHTSWIYPQSEKYAERDYQLSITHSAILQNTLVSLPTGLGKTLIAAVVMYNYYRWFPTGKIVFLAPTRPLVTQQIEACYNIMGIPEMHTAEMSGRTKPTERNKLWKERRVFFCTPQTFEKDIEEDRCDAKMVVCVVLDEAHKSTGNYAYVKVIKLMEKAGAKFRVVGLSATPGKNLPHINEVIKALRISKIEARLDSDPQVQKYVHNKEFETIVVEPTSEINSINYLFGKLLDPLLDMLRSRNGIRNFRGSNATITSYNLIMAMQDLNKIGDYSLNHMFLVTSSLLRVRESLRENGMGLARHRLLTFNTEHTNKNGFAKTVIQSEAYKTVFDAIVNSQSIDKVNSTAEQLKLYNPKLSKLVEILTEHFERNRVIGRSSRAIVFSQWRESVEEIVQVLAGSKPLLQPQKFVGQGTVSTVSKENNISKVPHGRKKSDSKVTGMTQKEQQRVIKEFRNGIHNVLVCTCIGEEGLDIGEVDLIVNFDCLRSPIRMVQRTGRTGRKRNGRVVCLMSKGQEQRKHEQAGTSIKLLWKALKSSNGFAFKKNDPLLPVHPVLMRQDMQIKTKYRMSQIGGHGYSTKNSNSCDTVEDDNLWRLTTVANKQRRRLFGKFKPKYFTIKECIKSWQRHIPTSSQSYGSIVSGGVGSSCLVLRGTESFALTYISQKGQASDEIPSNNSLSQSWSDCENSLIETCDSFDPSDVVYQEIGSSGEMNGDLKQSKHSKMCLNLPESNVENCGSDDDTHHESKSTNNVRRGRSKFERINQFNITCKQSEQAMTVLSRIRNGGIFLEEEEEEGAEKSHTEEFEDARFIEETSLCNATETLNCKEQHCEESFDSGINDIDTSPTTQSRTRLDLTKSNVESYGSDQDTCHEAKSKTEICTGTSVLERKNQCEITTYESERAQWLKVSVSDHNVSFDLQCHQIQGANGAKNFSENNCVVGSTSNMSEDNVIARNSIASLENMKTSHINNNHSDRILGVDVLDENPLSSFCFDLPSQDMSSSSSSSDESDSESSRIAFTFTIPENDSEIGNNLKNVPSAETPSRVSSSISTVMHLASPCMSKMESNKEQGNSFFGQEGYSKTASSSAMEHFPEKGSNITSIEKCEATNLQSNSDDPNSTLSITPLTLKSNYPRKKMKLTIIDEDEEMGSQKTNSGLEHSGLRHSPLKRKALSEPPGDDLIDTPEQGNGLCASRGNMDAFNDLTDTPEQRKNAFSPSEKTSESNDLTHTPIKLMKTPTSEVKKRKKAIMEKLTRGCKGKLYANGCIYLDEEAECRSDSSDEDLGSMEDSNVQSQNSFINDSSQLDYSQETPCQDIALHRQVDAFNDAQSLYSTPMLRRRHQLSQIMSIPSSEKALGKMHFIKSVIDHHRKGGDCNDIEREYNMMFRDCRESQESEVSERNMQVCVHSPHDSISMKNSIESKLTEEQLSRIARNREKALMIRRSKLQHTRRKSP